MRQFALGALLYDPERFSRMLVGDFLDAMAGYNQAEDERVKSLSEIIRTSTSLLFNIQLKKEDRVTEEEIWPLPWDKKNMEKTSPEEFARRKEASLKWMTSNFLN